MSAEAVPAASDGKDEEATRLWAACHTTPWDFDSWMALIPFLERGGEPMRPKLKEAYEEFLVEFPLCYGYWDKLAKFEKAGEGGVDAALQVYERGLVAVPCPELYVSYCGCAVDAAGPPSADGEPIGAGEVRARETFEKAIAAMGGEWKSVTLWDYYVRFEEGRGGAEKDARIAVLSLRAAMLATGCAEKFMVSLRAMLEEKEGIVDAVMGALPEEDKAACAAAEGEERKKAVLAAAEKNHEAVKGEIQKRAPFEDKILRPYFHVKPLALDQKDTWHAYIDATVGEGDTALATKLFERCLIPCALYVEFWEKYAAFLEEQGNVEAARAVVERGCKGPFRRRPDLKLMLALYEEALGRAEAAEAVYNELSETSAPDSVEVLIRIANFHRRRTVGGAPGAAQDKAAQVYEAGIKRFADKEDLAAFAFLSIHYATMLAQVKGDMSKAREVLSAALAACPTNKNLVQAYVHLELAHGGPEAEGHVRAAYLAAIDEKSSMGAEDKVELQIEYVDFEHDRGSDVARLRAAQSALRLVLQARATEEQRRLASHKRPNAGASPAHDPKRARPAAAAYPPPQQGAVGYDAAAYQAWYAQQQPGAYAQGYQQPAYQAPAQYGYAQQYPGYGY